MAISLRAGGWASCLALALHNGEEIVGNLPLWAAAQPQLGWLARLHGPDWFVPAAIALVVLACAFAFCIELAPRPWMAPALRFFAVAMLANAASHLALSAITGSLMPGIFTAVLVLLPLYGWIAFSRPSRDGLPERAGQ